MNVNDFKPEFAKVMEFLRNDINQLRTGRATTAILDGIMVEAYGSRQSLKAVATIMIADAKSLTIEPWDKGQLPAIEKAIRESSLGLNPNNDGRLIRLILPDLTADRRAELVKVLHQKLESAKISVRKVREEARALIAMEESEKTISEDVKFKLQEDLEKMVKSYNDEIMKIGEGKEKEITTV